MGWLSLASTPHFIQGLADEDGVTARYRLHLFNADVSSATTTNDNVTKAMDNDDRSKYLGYVDLPAMADLGEFSFAQADQLQFMYVLADGADTLYGILEDLDGETAETAGMVVDITLYAHGV